MSEAGFICRRCGTLRSTSHSSARIVSHDVNSESDPAGGADDLVEMRPACPCGFEIFKKADGGENDD